MLDDLKYIHSKDPSDVFGQAAKQLSQLTHAFEFTGEPKAPIHNVVFAGMGGSGLWAFLSLVFPGYKVPFEIWRRYDGPPYVSKNTLLIASSYSGGTEETLSAVGYAQKAGAQVVAVARGGKLIESAKDNDYPYIILPETSQPRLGTFSGFASLMTIAERYDIAAQGDILSTLNHAASSLEPFMATWAPDVATDKNFAKQLALEVAGTTPVVYSGTELAPSAYKWKIGFNEAAKNVAWWNEIPESSHNEFLGWSSHPVQKPYSVIDLRSSFEHPQISKRFVASEKLLSGKRPHPHTVEAKGNNILEHNLYLMLLGEYVSLYVAMLNGQDPGDFALVDRLKSAL